MTGMRLLVGLLILLLNGLGVSAEPVLQVDIQSANILQQDWKGQVNIMSLSNRAVSLTVVPEVPEPQTIQLIIPDLDPGEYFLAVSGSAPVKVTSATLAGGVSLTIPAVVGHLSRNIERFVKEWAARVNRARVLSEELGVDPDEVPPEIRKLVDQIIQAPSGLDQATASRFCVIRVNQVGVGSLELPPLSSLSLEEIQNREQQTRKGIRTLLGYISGIDDIWLRDRLLEVLLPVELKNPQGSLVDLVTSSQAGQGQLSFHLVNPAYNPEATLELELGVPEGWKGLSNLKWNLTLPGGQDTLLEATYEIPAVSAGMMVEIPVQLKIHALRMELQRSTSLGVGNHFISDWQVIGPFNAANGADLDPINPPDINFEPTAEYAGMDGPVKWKTIHARSNGLINLAETLGMKEKCLGYAISWVYVPWTQMAQFYTGSDDGIRVIVNGEKVHEARLRRAAHPGEDQFLVRLNQGWNKILVKVAQEVGQWEFFFEIKDLQGRIPEGLERSFNPPPRISQAH